MSGNEYGVGRLGSLADDSWVPPVIDTTRAHPARMYNAYLGGKDNFAADREAAEQIIAKAPEVRDLARANRAFLGHAVRMLAEQGIDQFLDIGTGIPTADNTHEVAQRVNPAAKVVYVDNDPIVLAHARALMAGHGMGATTIIQADLRDPASILADPALRGALDFGRPMGLILLAVLHFVSDEDGPAAIVKQLTDVLAPGSRMVLSHATTDVDPRGDAAVVEENQAEAVRVYGQKSVAAVTLRTGDRIRALFDGLELLPPGIASVYDHLADPDVRHHGVGIYGGIARKP
ncbi:SAM-dependent methyltransferase [Streptacidiphilus carbonis]|uniref:SAM-dependent methyltransferase n=1 Tax=Streptacidiphilus carbonis TaxID=105422 RepID=UPI000A02CB40|nr:SAM-dependent methyltransferase [Streptacidiphilus carbonis]